MTTITLPRATVEQALEALVSENSLSAVAMQQRMDAIRALRAALAQQAEPVDTDCHTQGICQRSGYGILKP